jgi:two-component system phosphate regulon sensor histidine kinase PhoR
MLGFAAASAIGRPLPEVSRSRALHDCVRQALSSSRASRSEIEAPGEPRRTLAVIAAPLSGNRSAGVLIVLHDISELRRLENLRKEFVANVSHELKTPLSSIKAYAETLRMGAIHDTEHRMSFVERIEEQAERLHELIIDLLQLARIEAGQQAFDFDDVPLLEAARSCLHQFAEAAGAKSIQLSVDENSPHLVVHVDEEGLRTVLNNLIDNAIKYTSANGRVRVSWRSEGGYGVIAVADTGIGIALRDQTRIFERFFRADKARSRELGGTGLGLSIVKHLCQAFGGDVVVESQEGAGSTFRVRLPLASASLARATADDR